MGIWRDRGTWRRIEGGHGNTGDMRRGGGHEGTRRRRGKRPVGTRRGHVGDAWGLTHPHVLHVHPQVKVVTLVLLLGDLGVVDGHHRHRPLARARSFHREVLVQLGLWGQGRWRGTGTYSGRDVEGMRHPGLRRDTGTWRGRGAEVLSRVLRVPVPRRSAPPGRCCSRCGR